jgi:DNA-binding HxlR family transcriptional regulator
LARLPALDPVIHGKLRLAIMSLLAGAEEADFNYLKEQIAATDGNLSVHLSKLEKARYISVKKQFVGKKPRTTYRMTRLGREAFSGYVADVKRLLGSQLDR